MNKILIALSLVLVVLAGRYIPHLPNFAPVMAVGLFSSVFLGRRYGVAITLSAMFLSDAVIGFYGPGTMLFNYAAIATAVLFKNFLGSKNNVSGRGVMAVAGSSVTGSVVFFLISNIGVWACSGMYGHSVSGIASCFELAFPFLTYTLAGDLFYNTILFGSAYAAQAAWVKSLKTAKI
jgi:hypothetical protein